MNAGDRANGFRDGVRYAVTWLHERANEMNDEWAKAVLNTAAFHLGVEGKQGTIDAKWKLLEIALARASAPAIGADGLAQKDGGER